MPTDIQRSFAGGEISPAMAGRADQSKHETGAKTVRNFVVQRFGGVTNRPGTKYIAEVKDSTKKTRLIGWEFSDADTYIIEMGAGYFRFYRNGGQVTLGSTPSAWATATAYGVKDLVSNGGVNYYCYTAHTSGASDEPGVGANWQDFWHALTGTVYEIPNPFAETELFDVQFVQSLDIMTIVHAEHQIGELTRTGHTSWKYEGITASPGIAAPANLSVTKGPAGSDTYEYVVTAVDQETNEESVASTADSVTSAGAPTSSNPHTMTFDAVAGAGRYNVYRKLNGIYGYIGSAGSGSFSDFGSASPNIDETPPIARTPFSTADNYPSSVTYVQQRLTFGGTNNDPQKVWMSRVGNFKNFTIRTPLQDDDSVTFEVAGQRRHAIRHLIDLGRLVLLTANGEYTMEGDADGSIKPTAINLKQRGHRGSAKLAPVIVGDTALYLQARNSIVRDLRYFFEADGYRGRDLTIFAEHLFRNATIDQWAYQESPNSVIWAVRDDGVLLGLTYLQDHEIWGWHRHDTGADEDGDTPESFESVAVVSESNEDAVYVVVKRTVNGSTVRYVERFQERVIDPDDYNDDAFFVDSGLSYDGENTSSKTLTLSGGTTWAYDELLTLTASASEFVSGDVGNEYWLRDANGDEVRCLVRSFTSATVVSVTPHKTVPTTLRSVAVTDWSAAVDQIAGLDHLEGRRLAIIGDGGVVSNGNDDSNYTVSSGSVTLDKNYAKIHAGLPYTSDLETLDIENPQGETLVDKKKIVNEVTVLLDESLGMWAGYDADNLRELIPRGTEDYTNKPALKTGPYKIRIPSAHRDRVRMFIRQRDPVPCTVLAVAPTGFVGE